MNIIFQKIANQLMGGTVLANSRGREVHPPQKIPAVVMYIYVYIIRRILQDYIL